MPYKNKEEQIAYQIAWMRKRREAWLNENGPCVLCGSWIDLEVDHRDPATKVTHRVWSWAQSRREEELAKCQALCKACHEEKSAAQHHRRRLSDAEIREIRASDTSHRKLAERYRVGKTTITNIKSGGGWKHVH